MKRENVKSIADIVSSFVRINGLEHGLLAVDVARAFDDAVGEEVLRYVTERFFVKDFIVCRVSSSVIRHRLFMNRLSIVESVNRKLGKDCVRTLVLK